MEGLCETIGSDSGHYVDRMYCWQWIASIDKKKKKAVGTAYKSTDKNPPAQINE